MMPPPPKTEKSVGERRLTGFTPVGISVCEELIVDEVVSGIEDKVGVHGCVGRTRKRAIHLESNAVEERMAVGSGWAER